MSAVPKPSNAVEVRRAEVADAKIAGEICYRAFAELNARHGFPPDFPNAELATGLLKMLFGHPGFFGLVAELNGEVVGSNCLDERNPIAGVGPITVRPDVQELSVGRTLMNAVMDRAVERGFAGVRLVQAAFNTRSMSLYTKLGYEIREPLATLSGSTLKRQMPGSVVRPGTAADLGACNRLCRKVHGHDRAGELEDAMNEGTVRVCERGGEITGYATDIGFLAHAVGESNRDIIALIAAAEEIKGPGLLLPTRNTEVFQWCLANKLRVVHPMTLMTVGLYNEPKGAWLPSILY